MKILTIIVRTLLGLAFVVFGLNGFLQLFKRGAPPPPDSAAGHFFTAFSTSGYMQVVSACQLFGGLLLLVNFLPVLGLTILCPIVFNIIAFHLTMAPSNMGPAIIVTVFSLFLVWVYWDHYRPLFRQPTL